MNQIEFMARSQGKTKKQIEELVNKAQAFDIIKKNVPNIMLEDKQLIVISFGYAADRTDLTEEQYEILKKAGL